MGIPNDRRYSESHEWFLVEGGLVTIGITQYAADELTDITYVDLPEVGGTVAAGDAIGEIESVKATSELFTAVAGEIMEVNDALADHPELINEQAFDDGWIVKIKAESVAPLNDLMDAKAYAKHIEG
jgi:glycine cleavage system H protein